uniref:Uncharacterized protein n=1 Tax=Ustilago esculenta TaxID=185366 RepID=A0A481SFU7_9BASI|nr:hypothetical protein UEMT_2064 [Ustilago esculenta]
MSFRFCICLDLLFAIYSPVAATLWLLVPVPSLRSLVLSTLVNSVIPAPFASFPLLGLFYGAQQGFQQPAQQNGGAYNGQGY